MLAMDPLSVVGVGAMPDLPLDGRVLAFSLGVTLVTGVIFGLAPSLQTTKPDLVPALKDAQGRSIQRGPGRFSLRNLLVVAQVALCFILLIGAGLFVPQPADRVKGRPRLRQR